MFRRNISQRHEKSSTAQLLSFVFLVVLIAVVVRLGAPGLAPEQPHDEASIACMPYAVSGQGETWQLVVRVEKADEQTAAPYQAAADQLKGSDDVIGYEEALAAVPLYKAVFTLEYLGDDMSQVDNVSLDFAPGTDYRAQIRRSRNDTVDFDGLITGRVPVMTLYYPQNVSIAGRIPPMGETYSARVRTNCGTDTISLSLQKEAGL